MYFESVSFSCCVDGLWLLVFIGTFRFHVPVCLNGCGSGVKISSDKNNEDIGEQTQLLGCELTCWSEAYDQKSTNSAFKTLGIIYMDIDTTKYKLICAEIALIDCWLRNVQRQIFMHIQGKNKFNGWKGGNDFFLPLEKLWIFGHGRKF